MKFPAEPAPSREGRAFDASGRSPGFPDRLCLPMKLLFHSDMFEAVQSLSEEIGITVAGQLPSSHCWRTEFPEGVLLHRSRLCERTRTEIIYSFSTVLSRGKAGGRGQPQFALQHPPRRDQPGRARADRIRTAGRLFRLRVLPGPSCSFPSLHPLHQA